MTTLTRAATETDVRHVVAHLRPCDVVEQFARRFGDDRDELARDLVAMGPRAVVRQAFADRDGAPACILGAYTFAPGSVLLHAISTERWPDVARAVFLFGTRSLLPTLRLAGMRRAECDTLAANAAWRNMLGRIGFVEEGILRAAGRAGQDFVRAAWINPGWRPPSGAAATTVDARPAGIACRP